MTKIYKDFNGRIYMLKKHMNSKLNEEEFDDNFEDSFEEDFNDENQINDVISVFVSDFDNDSKIFVSDKVDNLTDKQRDELAKILHRNSERYNKMPASKRLEIILDIVEDLRESEDKSFDYDPDEEDFDSLEFDSETEMTDNDDEDIKPVINTSNNDMEDDVKNFIYALEQELKLDESSRSHFYLVLKNDPDTDYEVVVLGKQSSTKYIFNIIDPIEAVRAIAISDIDLDATMVDTDSIW